MGADIFHVDKQTDQHDFLANAPEKWTRRMDTEEHKNVHNSFRKGPTDRLRFSDFSSFAAFHCKNSKAFNQQELQHIYLNTFAASYLNTQGLNNSYLKSPALTLVDITFQSRALRSFSLNQLRNLSL